MPLCAESTIQAHPYKAVIVFLLVSKPRSPGKKAGYLSKFELVGFGKNLFTKCPSRVEWRKTHLLHWGYWTQLQLWLLVG